jgi:hypothetical protein
MTIEEQKAFLTREYDEAVRYMVNAEEVLAKSKRDDYHYADKKYVRMACGTAYNGVLIALDAWFVSKGVDEPTKKQLKVNSKGKPKKPETKPKPRKSIQYYEHNIAQIDKKLLDFLISAYNILHLYGYYDGITNVGTIKSGFEMAYKIIERIKPFTRD